MYGGVYVWNVGVGRKSSSQSGNTHLLGSCIAYSTLFKKKKTNKQKQNKNKNKNKNKQNKKKTNKQTNKQTLKINLKIGQRDKSNILTFFLIYI